MFLYTDTNRAVLVTDGNFALGTSCRLMVLFKEYLNSISSLSSLLEDV